LLFLNQTDLSFFDSLAVCEDNLGFSIEVLTREQAIVLYEMAEIAQIFTGVSQWWIGLSDFTHEGRWQWMQSSTEANLTLYSDFFVPQNNNPSDDCVLMTIIDRNLVWKDIDCMATTYEEDVIIGICQCKGSDCPNQPPSTTNTPPTDQTTTAIVCSDNWIDAGDLGCIQFMPDNSGLTFLESKALCEASNGFLIETKTMEAIEFVSTLANVIHSYTPGIESWWLGLVQVGTQWMWAHSTETVVDSNWDAGQPNGHNGCGILTLSTTGEYKWDDVDCTGGEHNGLGIAPICQECRPEDNCNIVTDTSPTNSPTPTVEPSTSPKPWPEGCKNSTNLSGCYLHVGTKSSWLDAEEDCAAMGGHLVSSLSEEENNFVGESVIRFENVWLGGTDMSGSWAWSDSQPWGYENWKTGEPSGGNCVYFNWQTYKWSASQCSVKLKYVCKFI